MTDNYLEWEWRTRDGQAMSVREMTRDHVRNALQWCLAREHRSVVCAEETIVDLLINFGDKDGRLYREWINVFTARLLDPELDD